MQVVPGALVVTGVEDRLVVMEFPVLVDSEETEEASHLALMEFPDKELEVQEVLEEVEMDDHQVPTVLQVLEETEVDDH